MSVAWSMNDEMCVMDSSLSWKEMLVFLRRVLASSVPRSAMVLPKFPLCPLTLVHLKICVWSSWWIVRHIGRFGSAENVLILCLSSDAMMSMAHFESVWMLALCIGCSCSAASIAKPSVAVDDLYFLRDTRPMESVCVVGL